MKKKDQTAENIRAAVSQDYARAVTQSTGCCGGGSCCGGEQEQNQKGVIAKLAGYTNAELAALPPEAVMNSFGCGNPLAFSGVRPGQTVLDLGAGAGIDLLLAARKVGSEGKAIGVDMTDEMISKARHNIAASGMKNVEIRKGLIEELPVENNSVDWVISNCVINLSPEKDRVFKEIARVLKPGGAMLVSDVVATDLPEIFKADQGMYSACLAGAISEAEYLAGLARAGLTGAVVQERLVYDASQLQAFIGSELKNEESCGCSSECCGGNSVRDMAENWAEKLQGKIWSARIFARKPL